MFQVDVKVAPDSVEPGKTVDVIVKAKPNSYVGVLGVDQSVLLLRTGNDITQVRWPLPESDRNNRLRSISFLNFAHSNLALISIFIDCFMGSIGMFGNIVFPS